MANVVNVCQSKNKQFFCTFPKGVAQMMGLKKGDKLEFRLNMGEIVIRKV